MSARRSRSSKPPAAELTQEGLTRRLARARSLVLFSHDRPDGDALGSMVALASSARLAGKDVKIACSDPVPRRYAFLVDGETLLDAPAAADAVAAAELVCLLDTCTWNQVESVADVLRAADAKLVVIDHHQTHEPLGVARWIDPSAAAVGVMVTELLDRLKWPVDMTTARAATTAICSDTGWLQFANTDARALCAVGHWLDYGVSPDELYRTLYQNDRPERLRLLGRMLSGMELLGDGRQLAVLTARQADFDELGAGYDETENLINEVLRIGQVEVAAMLVEQDQRIRCSLRSKGRVDVAAVAQSLGGGGHVRAAGVRLDLPLDQARQALVDAVCRHMH